MIEIKINYSCVRNYKIYQNYDFITFDEEKITDYDDKLPCLFLPLVQDSVSLEYENSSFYEYIIDINYNTGNYNISRKNKPQYKESTFKKFIIWLSIQLGIK